MPFTMELLLDPRGEEKAREMRDNSQLELIRETASQPSYKQTVNVNAGQLLAEIEREYLPRENAAWWDLVDGTERKAKLGENFDQWLNRCYLPRPIFDDGEPVREGDVICIDGELPLKVYWWNVRNDGLTVFGCPTSTRQIKTGERVKREKPVVLDADGVPIRKGDTVWCIERVFGDDCECEVVDVQPNIERAIIRRTLGGAEAIATPINNLTHKKPDSLERIEEDAKLDTCAYFGHDKSTCDGCRMEKRKILPCDVEKSLDLLRRQREVLERGHER